MIKGKTEERPRVAHHPLPVPAGITGPDGGACAECTPGTYKATGFSDACEECHAGRPPFYPVCLNVWLSIMPCKLGFDCVLRVQLVIATLTIQDQMEVSRVTASEGGKGIEG